MTKYILQTTEGVFLDVFDIEIRDTYVKFLWGAYAKGNSFMPWSAIRSIQYIG